MVVLTGSICKGMEVNHACPYGLQRKREREFVRKEGEKREKWEFSVLVYVCGPHTTNQSKQQLI